MGTTFDESSEFIKEIRGKIADIMKQIDDFVAIVEARVKTRENELTEQMKKFETLKDREAELENQRLEVEKSKKELHKQTSANREKQIALDKKEQGLQDKLQRVQSILN